MVSAISTSLLSFVGADRTTTLDRLALLVGGVALIVLLARSRRLNRWMTPIIRRALSRTTPLDLRDYAQLLHLRDDWRVAVIGAGEDGWLASGSLDRLEPWSEGVTVLGIERAGGGYEGAPSGEAVIEAGDRVILYGRTDRLSELSERQGTDRAAHERAKKKHARSGGGTPRAAE